LQWVGLRSFFRSWVPSTLNLSFLEKRSRNAGWLS
jgi:hypothetical protein